jgi:hypothetical protein
MRENDTRSRHMATRQPPPTRLLFFLFPFQSALSAITINWRSEATAGCTTAVTSAAADAIAIATLAAKIILLEFCSALDWCAVSDGAENRLFRHRLCFCSQTKSTRRRVYQPLINKVQHAATHNNPAAVAFLRIGLHLFWSN